MILFVGVEQKENEKITNDKKDWVFHGFEESNVLKR
jgi:hypothetical protein